MKEAVGLVQQASKMIEQARGLLKRYFGYDSFRTGQEEIISAILNHQDVLAILPTGGGKSLCYQLPALLEEGVAIVISPLISLMKDQVDELNALGIPAKSIHSYLDSEEERAIFKRLASGEIKLLYVSPERFSNKAFLNYLKGLTISFVAVDEAHCVSSWGHDFRPSYQMIQEGITYLEKPIAVCAFTATATDIVRRDIVDKLNLKKPFFFLGSFDRKNLFFALKKPSDKKKWLKENLSNDIPTIIYCSTRKNVEMLYDYLMDNYFKVTYYHGGLSKEEREKNQDDFIHDRKAIILATNAFGMGIDKSNVRRVIHYNMPKDIESYYQEAGRAGRDGADAEVTLLFSAKDIMVSKFLVEQSKMPKAKENLDKMIGYAYTTGCLRNYILSYFGEGCEPCDNCSVCKGDFIKTDITKEAQMILSTVYRVKQSYGASIIVDILKGSKNEKIRRLGLENISTYGLLKEYKTKDIRDMLSLLVYEGHLSIVGHDYPYLVLTEDSRQVLFENKKVSINKAISKENYSFDRHLVDKALLANLKNLRKDIASNLEIAPYMVFSDKTLEEMAIKYPTSNEAFLAITGVGQKKLESYGVSFMTMIKKYIEVTKPF